MIRDRSLKMKEKSNGILEFDNSKFNDPKFELAVKEYTFRRHGSSILIYLKSEDILLCQFNPFDNTIFICDPKGFPIADLLGTKRFIVGTARKFLNEMGSTQAINFARDLSFPLMSKKQSLPESLKIVSDAKNHPDLSDMLVRSSGFTPQKIEEYKKNRDALCRFNPCNRSPVSGTVACHVFLADTLNQDRIVGIMAADIIITNSDLIDVYLRDEIIENPCTMQHLFEAARQVIHHTFDKINIVPQADKVNAFIRAAPGKEQLYKNLGCSSANPGIYVIHGPRTALAEMLDEYIKSVMIVHEEVLRKPFVTAYPLANSTHTDVNEPALEFSVAENIKFHFFNPYK